MAGFTEALVLVLAAGVEVEVDEEVGVVVAVGVAVGVVVGVEVLDADDVAAGVEDDFPLFPL